MAHLDIKRANVAVSEKESNLLQLDEDDNSDYDDNVDDVDDDGDGDDDGIGHNGSTNNNNDEHNNITNNIIENEYKTSVHPISPPELLEDGEEDEG
jgi:hypothetical protein